MFLESDLIQKDIFIINITYYYNSILQSLEIKEGNMKINEADTIEYSYHIMVQAEYNLHKTYSY